MMMRSRVGMETSREEEQVGRGRGSLPRERVWLYYPLLCIFVACVPILFLFGMLFWGKWSWGRWGGRGSNTSTSRNISTSTGSHTALKTLQFRAQAAKAGFGPDTLAPLLWEHCSVVPGPPGRLLLDLQVLLFRTTGRWSDHVLGQVARMPFSGTAYLHARTCWLDDTVCAFCERYGGQEVNIVVLGAGYDTRAYRFRGVGGVHAQWWEVDAGPTQDQKLLALDLAGVPRHHVRFVPVDFSSQSWSEELDKRGLDAELPTLVLWEGVTYYLDPDVVTECLKDLSLKYPRVIIAFDYFISGWVHWYIRWGMKLGGEPFLCLFNTHTDVESLLAEHGFTIVEQHLCETLRTRYLPSDGVRTMGFFRDFGGYVCASVGTNPS